MNLQITADNEPDPAAKAWLPLYVRSVFDEVVPYVREVAALPDDPWESYLGLLHVHLHPDGSVGYAGLTSAAASPSDRGFFNPRAYCRIDIAWNFEAASWDLDEGGYSKAVPDVPPRLGGHFPLRHELLHFFEAQTGVGWMAEGGRANVFLQAMQDKLDFLFHGDEVIRRWNWVS